MIDQNAIQQAEARAAAVIRRLLPHVSTEREAEILTLYQRYLWIAETASLLELSHDTVTRHFRRVRERAVRSDEAPLSLEPLYELEQLRSRPSEVGHGPSESPETEIAESMSSEEPIGPEHAKALALSVVNQLAPHASTDREAQVLEHYGRQLSLEQTAEAFGISRETVTRILRRIRGAAVAGNGGQTLSLEPIYELEQRFNESSSGYEQRDASGELPAGARQTEDAASGEPREAAPKQPTKDLVGGRESVYSKTYYDTLLAEICANDEERRVIQALKDTAGEVANAARLLEVRGQHVERIFAKVRQRAIQRGYAPYYGIDHLLPEGMGIRRVSSFEMDGVERGRWVIAEKDDQARRDLLDRMYHAFHHEIPRAQPIDRPSVDTDFQDHMVVIPLADAHFGLYCWKKETGEHFDLKTAERNLCNGVRHLVHSVPKARKCVIVNLGDFFHADTMQGETSRHRNRLDMAARMPEVMDVGVKALRQCIHTALERFEEVEVVSAIGNHDEILSYMLRVMLRSHYEHEPRVHINEGEGTRSYVRFQDVLLGVTHGDKTKDRDLPLIMATERQQDWGETRHRVFMRGHHHHDERMEYNGCVVEQFRTIAPTDAFAHGLGYLSSQDLKAIVYHGRFGEVFRSTCSLDMLRTFYLSPEKES